VLAAVLAGIVGTASATRYEATADDWQERVQQWTVTANGPYSPRPYYVRLTKDGNPNAATTYNIGDSRRWTSARSSIRASLSSCASAPSPRATR
jgi:glucoamylase